MKPLPIQWKFALWSAAASALALVVFAAGTLYNLYQEQLEAIDLAVAAEGQRLAASVARNPDNPETSATFHPWMGFMIFAPDGSIKARSKRLDEAIGRRAVTQPGLSTQRGTPLDWRVWSGAAPHGHTVVMAHDFVEMHEVIEDLLISYVLTLPSVLLAAALGGAWVAHRALRPIRELANAAGAVAPDRLDRRVPEPAAEDDLRRLAATLNAMLTRLEKTFQQTQRFAADASHELRTPLTIMRGEIEHLLHSDLSPSLTEERLVSLQEEISRLDRITEHLLLLARFDAGNIPKPRERVDFSALVLEACEDAELIAAGHHVTLQVDVAPGAALDGDPLLLRRLVLNLLDNAVRHNRPEGAVACALALEPDALLLRVRNTGPGIPATSRPELFQRFFRADPARRRGGHGLGLALSREIARAHGGDIALTSAVDAEWTEFTLRLPR